MKKILVVPSIEHTSFMQKYCNIFSTIFTAKLIAFGYEQIDTKGNFLSITNSPRLPELFIETSACETNGFLIY